MTPLVRSILRDPRAVVCSGAAVILAVVVVAQTTLRFAGADHGFERYTQVALPDGVRVLGHGSSAMKDDLFHTYHYWLIEGPGASLRSLATTVGMRRSDDDARAMLPDTRPMFGVALREGDVVEGYIGSAGKGRDRWLMLLADGKGAVFAAP